MNRRELLRTAILGTVVLGVPEIVNGYSDDVGDTVEYRGYLLRWSGFIASPNSDKVVCRWMAAYKDKRFFYASHPGTEGIGVKGEMICTDVFTDQHNYLEDYLADPRLAQCVKASTLFRIKGVIDRECGV